MTLPPRLPPPDELSPLDATLGDPTPAEIRLACQRIQATWSDQERRYRALVPRPRDLEERPDRDGSCSRL